MNTKTTKNVMYFDVLIVGSGIAGLSAGIELAQSGISVGILTREKDPKISNTFYAQGGIIYAQGDHDLLVEDIQKASGGTSNLVAARKLAECSGPILHDLLIQKANTEFERTTADELMLTKEAAHSESRIIYKGDYTGKAIQISLLRYLQNNQNFPQVSFLTEHTAIDLITPNHHGVGIQQRYENNRALGVYAYNSASGKVVKILSRITILATGGVGALYLHHSNAEGARGDGHAMAKRAGASMVNMEFIQFHPTTFYDRSSHRRFLISEAVRGEGGVLINAYGETFMEKYHPDKDLAPRDVVARAIVEEMIESKHDCVYLDISYKDAHWLKQRFPTIYKHCQMKGIDITQVPIPVVPAAHYTCGGVKTDLVGKTTLAQLYAVGEVACTGLHGANRLASTSLLEGLTWGVLAARDILQHLPEVPYYAESLIKNWELADDSSDLALITQDMLTIKQTMWNYVGLTRSRTRLQRAQVMFRELSQEVMHFYKNSRLSDELIGLRNAIEVATMVVESSMRNKESVGCFYLEK